MVQYQYLKIGLNLAKVQFSQKVGDAGKLIKEDLKNKNQLTILLEKAITRDSSYFNLSIDSLYDASQYFLQDYISLQLVQQGIKSDFTFRLYTKDSLYNLISKASDFETDTDLIRYPLELKGYLPGELGRKTFLELRFKNLNQYFLFQLNGLTIPGLIFMIAIVGVVIWVLRSFYWQRSVITTTNEFINNLTHELKTPVFAIGVAAKILEEEVSKEKQPVLSIIKDQIKKLNDHTNKVLDLSNLERRQSVFALERLDLKPVITEVCESFKLLSALGEIDFKYSIEGDHFWIRGDAFHLSNSISNLLDNAKKYSLNEPIVNLRAYKKGNKLVISVMDKGIGVDKDHLDLIFKKYYRVSNGDTHNVKGYGLGLSYVKRVITGHSGKIYVSSEKKKGTEVTIELNLCG